MTSQVVTRSGLEPADNGVLSYDIKTSDVEAYIQKKLDTVANRVAQQTKQTVEHIKVNVYATESGRDFVPFVIILPMEALQQRNRKFKNMNPIFDTKEEDRTAVLKKEVYEVLSSYTFNKQDGEMFKSDSWKRSVRMNHETARVLLSMRTPRVIRLDQKTQVIELLLDPLKVFHDMLKIERDNRQFMVNVKKWKKINEDGEYLYLVERALSKNQKNKNYKSTIMDQLTRRMKGYNNRH